MYDEKGFKILPSHPGWMILKQEWELDFSNVTFVEFEIVAWTLKLGTQPGISICEYSVLSGMSLDFAPTTFGDSMLVNEPVVIKQPNGVYIIPSVPIYFKTEADLKTYLIAEKNA